MSSYAPPEFIPVMAPVLEGNEEKYLMDAFKSSWISSLGKYIGLFETAFSAFTQSRFSVAVNSGTAALHLALAAKKIGPGDQVILPDLTFAATINMVILTGAEPVIVDVRKEDYTIDPQLVEKMITRRTKAVIPVHILGKSCDMDPILDIAKRHNLAVIEDAAEAHGASYKGRPVGSIGDVGCFSFFANKIMTTGEGGICVSNDEALIDEIRLFKDHGMDPQRRYIHNVVGFNYRMTNLQAAIGLAQVEQVGQSIRQKKSIASWYTQRLSDVPGILQRPISFWETGVCWLYYLTFEHSGLIKNRDRIMMSLKEAGIETRPMFYPLHKMPPYRREGRFQVTESISEAGMFLPSSNSLTKNDIDYICGMLEKVCRQYI